MILFWSMHYSSSLHTQSLSSCSSVDFSSFSFNLISLDPSSSGSKTRLFDSSLLSSNNQKWNIMIYEYHSDSTCHPLALITPYSSLSTLYDLIWSIHLSQSLFIPIHFHSLHISLYALLHTTKTVFDPSYTIQTMHYKINKQQTYNIRHQSILCIWLGHQ